MTTRCAPRRARTGPARWLPLVLAAALIAAAGALTTGHAGSDVKVVVTDEQGKPVEDAVVYLAPLDGRPVERRAGRAVMDQIDRTFVPYVLPVVAGTAVSFPNRDNIRHHVYSFSPAKRFELPLYTVTPAAPVVFDTPGVVALGCNIHDWMLAYVYVLATPYFARTDGAGQGSVPDVPPGRYEARVWHPDLKGGGDKSAKEVTVGAPEAASVQFVVSVKRRPRPRPPAHDPRRYEGAQGG
ncbi:MAG TPA: methylamine utilization protein [Candidatus Tectomicrobia bacterium]|nr:methylamine utilization protein [Candidatus Tectomicrobia bacterium]